MNDLLQFLQDAAINMCDQVIYSNFRSQASLKHALAMKRNILCNHVPVEVGDGEGLSFYYCDRCGSKL